MQKMARTLKIACVQLKVGANKSENVARALTKIRTAKGLGAELVALPGQSTAAMKPETESAHTLISRMFQLTLWS